jgi:hypothetical protein
MLFMKNKDLETDDLSNYHRLLDNFGGFIGVISAEYLHWRRHINRSF